MKKIILKVFILILVTAFVFAGTQHIISEDKINKFLELVIQARSNPNGLIYYSREIFTTDVFLPNNYKSLFKNYLIKFENNINYYTFLDLNNIGGRWWVKLEVDNLEGKILKLDAMGMTK